MASLRIHFNDEFRWVFTLLEKEVRIGRTEENHVVLRHAKVSREHARIRREGERFILEDRSGTGLDLNHQTITGAVLKDGDVIQIGAFRLVFSTRSEGGPTTDSLNRDPTLHLASAEPTATTYARAELHARAGPDMDKRFTLTGGIKKIGRSGVNDIVLSDCAVSSLHLEVEWSQGGLHVWDVGSTNGTRINGQKVQRATVPVGSEIHIGQTVLRLCMEEVTKPVVSLGRIVGQSAGMCEVFNVIRKSARKDVTVLIQAETGCGKQRVAEEIHALSPRRDGPFITLDCGAISPELIESDLFGHEKGAFTGAHTRRLGVFEQANRGTIFLDEIGELPLSMQPKMLRVMEEQVFRRVGGSETIRSDFRMVAATNRQLDAEVKAGRFRQDLYFRLNVLPLFLPPLRERLDDIPLLVDHFLLGKSMRAPKETMDKLMRHTWPGNVRELRNVIERAVVLAEGEVLQPDDILFLQTSAPGQADAAASVPPTSLDGVEKEAILRALQAHAGDKRAAAASLGIALSTLYDKLKRYQ